ncbi:PIN domain-containing protein [Rhizobium leguminosarum]|uniref:PIN domain-containing protein n=1 Tax=Rhizobium leguminosarum TaxID=384 RepID=UPI003ECCB17F
MKPAERETGQVRVFVDTNIFIEMKDLKDVDWRLMFPNLTEIHIVVSIHVIDELDTLKTDKSERKRRRALAALKTIDLAERDPILLRDKNFRVTLSVTLANTHFGNEFSVLDKRRPDDRLVAHVLEDGNAILVSDDRGPRMKLISLGGTALAPPHAFRLPPEESDIEMENRRLKVQIKAMADDQPRMKLKLLCPSNPIALKKQVLLPLDEGLSQDIIKRVLAASPKLKKNSSTWVGPLNPRNSFDWTRYEIEYANFAKAVGSHVATLHYRFNAVPVALPIPFEVINAGPVTLQNADVSIRLDGPGRLFVEQEGDDDEDDEDDDLFNLGFPAAPTFGYAFAIPRMRGLGLRPLKMLPMPGALTFEWDVLPDDDQPQHANLSNREFRVGKRHKDTIFIIPDGAAPLDLTLSFDLEATHLNQPHQEKFAVRIEQEEREWTFGDLERLEALIPSRSDDGEAEGS